MASNALRGAVTAVDAQSRIGRREFMTTAIAAGADGLIVEVHPDPKHAVSDGKQSLKPEVFAAMVKQVRAIAETMGRRIAPVKKQTAAGW